MASVPDAQVSVHGPWEDLAIEVVKLISKIVDGQSPEIKAKLWEGYIADMEAWRKFWASFHMSIGEGK